MSIEIEIVDEAGDRLPPTKAEIIAAYPEIPENLIEIALLLVNTNRA